MRFGIVGNLIAHSGFQGEPASIVKLGQQLALDTQENVTFDTPMIGTIAGGILNLANANVSKVLGSPEGHPAVALVLGWLYLGPVGNAERDICHLHGRSFRLSVEKHHVLILTRSSGWIKPETSQQENTADTFWLLSLVCFLLKT